MLVSIIQIYTSEVPYWFRLSPDSRWEVGWEGLEEIHWHWQNWGICAPCRKGAQTPKTHILVSNTLHIYPIYYTPISKDLPRDQFLPRLEFSWWAVEAMVTRIVAGEQGFVIIVLLLTLLFVFVFLLISLLLLFLRKWSRVVYVSGCCYLFGIVFVVAVQGFGFPR